MKEISALTEITQAASNDYLPILDTDDKSQGAKGSTKKITFNHISHSTETLIATGDDTANIIAAMASLPSNGGKIFLKGGEFIADTLTPTKQGITLEGEDKATTLKLKNSVNNKLINAVDISDFTLRNLIIDGNKNNNSASNETVVLDGVLYGILENVKLINSASQAISLLGANRRSQDIKITKCTILDAVGPGIIFHTNSTYNIEADNNYINNCDSVNVSKTASIFVHDGNERSIISKNHILASGGTGAGGRGIEIGHGIGPNAHTIVSGNYIENPTAFGIQIWAASQVEVVNNIIKGAGTDGIFALLLTHPIISGNQIVNAQNNGINLQKITYASVMTNIVSNAGLAANNVYSDIILNDADASYTTRSIISGNNLTSFSSNRTKYAIYENSINDDFNLITNNFAQGQRNTPHIVTQGVNTIAANNQQV